MALTTNLVAYWKLDETGTGNAADSSGGGFTLTNNGPWTYASAKIGNGFDGGATNTTKYGSNANTLGIDGTTNTTFNFWINVTTAPTSGNVVTPIRFENETSANNKINTEFQYYNNVGTLNCVTLRNDGAGNDQYGVGTANSLGTGAWHMLTMTWNGSTQNLYLDGNATPIVTGASTRTGTVAAPSGAGTFIKVGADSTNSRYFSGLMDEVGIWTRALTTTEISQLYNGGAGLQYPFSSNLGPAFLLNMI